MQRVTERNEKLSKCVTGRRQRQSRWGRSSAIASPPAHRRIRRRPPSSIATSSAARNAPSCLSSPACSPSTPAEVRCERTSLSVVSYINQAFSSSSTSSVFALYPPSLREGDADSRDQQLNYVHSLQKVFAVKVLSYAISHSLALTSPLTGLLQSILRDSGSVLPTASTNTTLMSNLLSIAQNVIPLTQGVGSLPSLDRKQTALHSLLHDRPLPPLVPPELKSLSIHVDLCHRALSLFGSDLSSAIGWLKGKHIGIKLEESQSKREVVSDVVRGLQEMGFSTALCQKALLLCNGDSNQAVSWLLEHGMTAMEDQRNGLTTENWGLEGVDFYQELGHIQFEFDREKPTKSHRPSDPHQVDFPLDDPKELKAGEASNDDPYRRLTLKTAPLMKEQSALNERYRVEQKGLEGRTTITCSLDEEDVRVGQLLRVNAAWCISESSAEREAEKQQVAQQEEYRWFFLTEDNNWAPLDAKDMRSLDEALLQRHSVVWVGVEEKTPSLIRLDKMCMYNELTGHGRPLKRKRVEKADGAPPHSQAVEPPVPVDLYSGLSGDLQTKATELAGLGFPLSHCARALMETKGNLDAAASWIISNEGLLEAMDKETEKKKQRREQWEVKQKEAAASLAAAAAALASPSGASSTADVAVSNALIFPHAGQLGSVQQLSPSGKQVLLSFTHPDTAPHVLSVAAHFCL